VTRARTSAPWPGLALLPALLAARPASAQDALRGKLRYLDAARLTGSGVSCVGCHGPYPPGLHGIAGAADRPEAIERAVYSIAAMAPFRGRLTQTDYADLAAYLGDPQVPSPAPVLRRHDGTQIAGALQLGAVAIGARATQSVVFENAGQLDLELLTAPAVDGESAAELTVRDSSCVPGPLGPGQRCQLTLDFAPQGAPGRRVARVFMEHDWVHGLSAIALIGVAGDTPPEPEPEPDPEPEPEPGGCTAGGTPSAGGALLLMALALRLRGDNETRSARMRGCRTLHEWRSRLRATRDTR
jgi:mono/diheme cytochrome c family protein